MFSTLDRRFLIINSHMMAIHISAEFQEWCGYNLAEFKERRNFKLRWLLIAWNFYISFWRPFRNFLKKVFLCFRCHSFVCLFWLLMKIGKYLIFVMKKKLKNLLLQGRWCRYARGLKSLFISNYANRHVLEIFTFYYLSLPERILVDDPHSSRK